MKTLTLLALALSFASAPAFAKHPLECKELALQAIQTFAKFNEDRVTRIDGVLSFSGGNAYTASWVSNDVDRKYFAINEIKNGDCLLSHVSMSSESLFGYRPSLKPEVCKGAAQVAVTLLAYFNGEKIDAKTVELNGPVQGTGRFDKPEYSWLTPDRRFKVRTMQNGVFTDGDCRVKSISYDDRGFHP